MIRWEGYGEDVAPTLEEWKDVKNLSAVKEYIKNYVKGNVFNIYKLKHKIIYYPSQ